MHGRSGEYVKHLGGLDGRGGSDALCEVCWTPAIARNVCFWDLQEGASTKILRGLLWPLEGWQAGEEGSGLLMPWTGSAASSAGRKSHRRGRST
jgi:hypothetical protein